MRRDGLLRHVRRHGCVLRREGKEHALWENPQTCHCEAVPRHSEIANLLAGRICRKLSVPDPPDYVQSVAARAGIAYLPRAGMVSRVQEIAEQMRTLSAVELR